MPHKILNHTVDIYQLHRRNRTEFPFLLESVAENEKIGRYDILFSKPQSTLCLEDLHDGDFLDAFDARWQQSKSDEDSAIPDDIPFRGGWFVFFSYELAQQIEPRLALEHPPYPIAYAAKCGSAIIVDKVEEKTYVVSDLSEANGVHRLMVALGSLGERNNHDNPVNQVTLANPANHVNQRNQSISHLLDGEVKEDAECEFIDGVEKSRQYIIDGDVFQVNLSRGWNFELSAAKLDMLYDNLRQSNPAPFAASCHVRYGQDNEKQLSILSSSPERLIKLKGGQIETRPIAGTRPRSHDKHADKALSSELIEHFKERAEHVMLIDLERNDIGRISQAGTVAVDELMVIESYAHVHHIVSNVIGRAKETVSPADAIRAVFPGGTITGCPKVRCMEIIRELEQTYRGVYTGALGYVNHNGDMDTNILIRTFACYDDNVEFRAGAGVVYDSIAEHELKETRNKAKGLLKAL